MPKPLHPGIYVEETGHGVRVISGAPTSIAAFVGRMPSGPVNEPVPCASAEEVWRRFGEPDDRRPMRWAIGDFFGNGGKQALIVRLDAPRGALSAAGIIGSPVDGTGLHALRGASIFNLLCLPPDAPDTDIALPVWQAAAALCAERRAFLIMDAPAGWHRDAAVALRDAPQVSSWLPPGHAANAALYYPAFHAGMDGDGRRPACGAVAGVIARTDARAGPWKAPAGLEAELIAAPEPAVLLDDARTGALNRHGVNTIRRFPRHGCVVWGARTLRGDDVLSDTYKYISVRRLALFIEDSIVRGAAWAAFEDNAPPLWSALRASIGVFMDGLFRRGAFQGANQRDAWFVRCGPDTTTASDIAGGVVRIVAGFAALKPAEFIPLDIALACGAGERS